MRKKQLHNVRAVQVSFVQQQILRGHVAREVILTLAALQRKTSTSLGKNFLKGKEVACLLHDFVEVR